MKLIFSVVLMSVLPLVLFGHGHGHDEGHVHGHGHSHDHGHGHGHSHEEAPSHKWSKAANTPDDDLPLGDKGTDKDKIEAGHGSSWFTGLLEIGQKLVTFVLKLVGIGCCDHGHGHDLHFDGDDHHHHGHSHGDHHGHSHGQQGEEANSSTSSIWFNAMLSTLLISAAPFFILFLIPLDKSAERQWLLKIMLAFASGGLLGDALLHLIPHAMMAAEADGGGHGHSHSHGHSHGDGGDHDPHDMSVGLGVLGGILAFLCVEKFVRIVRGGHGHSHDVKPEEKIDRRETRSMTKDKRKAKSSDNEENFEEDQSAEKKKEKVSEMKDEPKQEEEIQIAGYLNLFADCFHNFTDGLAIGASYLAGDNIGMITTLSILFHEIPHEIGDFAILIQSGVPRGKAIALQLLTAVGAITGCAVSLILGGATDAASKVALPFTAGGFIYIATVHVIPELLEGASFKQSVLEIMAMLAGVGMMVIIAQYE